MSFTLDSKDYLAGLAVAAKHVEADGERAVARTGRAAGDRAEALAPVETGALRDSMQVSEGHDDEGFFVEVAFTSDHAAEVEFGTSLTPAQSFLRPALAEAAANFARDAR